MESLLQKTTVAINPYKSITFLKLDFYMFIDYLRKGKLLIFNLI